MTDTVRVEQRENVATVTIDRPEKRNAMDVATRDQLREKLAETVDDEDIRIVVFRGAGDGSFIAGGDLETMAEYDALEGLEYLTEHAQGLYNDIADLTLPTVAAIDGYAFGGGLELALACDLRIASTSARLGLPEVGLGLLPAGGGTQRLARIAGTGTAKDLVLTGRTIDANEAERLGVVTRTYDEDAFEQGLREVTDRLRRQAPIAQRLANQAIDSSVADVGLDVERLAGALLFGTEDFQEGVDAFIDERQPDFRNQ